jgi:hypothetical protein
MPQSDSLAFRFERSRSRVAAAWGALPRKLRLAALSASVILIGLAVYTCMFSASSTLNVVCRHSLRSAELTIFIDGKIAHTEQLSGAARKRFGLFDTRIEGSFSKSLSVPAGRHSVQVRLRSAADGFDQARGCNVNLLAGQDATVVATTQRGGMSLAYQGPPVSDRGEMASGYFSSLRNLLVTVFGSAASAAIAFVVQEALRSRKTPTPATTQNS